MDEVVHGNEPLGGVDHEGVVIVTVYEDGHVMVPVQEDELLLAKHDEVGVHQLGTLGEAEEEAPEAWAPLADYLVAHARFPTVRYKVLHVLHPLRQKTYYAEQGEEQAPGEQRHAKVVGLTGLHPALHGEDGRDVKSGDVERVVPVIDHESGRLAVVEAVLYALNDVHLFPKERMIHLFFLPRVTFSRPRT